MELVTFREVGVRGGLYGRKEMEESQKWIDSHTHRIWSDESTMVRVAC